MILFIGLAIVVLLLLQDVILGLLLAFHFKDYSRNTPDSDLPALSIFIPARNEEKKIATCLSSLEKLDYPKGKLQLIIGNDESTDATAEIIKDWVLQGTNRVLVNIESSSLRQLNGKANALHQMYKVARGDLFLYSDADCIFPESWAKKMVYSYSKGTGLVTGITTVEQNSFFSRMQGMDWWLTLGMVKVISDLGHAVTSMGNNMLIERSAYEKAGGFGGIPMSVTEDFAIAKAIQKAGGYQLIHQVSPGNLVLTKGEKGLMELLAQRKRWLRGALSLPWYWIVLLLLQLFFFPAILVLLFMEPIVAVILWGMKVIFQSFFIFINAKRTETKLNFLDLLCFEIYYWIVSWSTIAFYFWPADIIWKGRMYK